MCFFPGCWFVDKQTWWRAEVRSWFSWCLQESALSRSFEWSWTSSCSREEEKRSAARMIEMNEALGLVESIKEWRDWRRQWKEWLLHSSPLEGSMFTIAGTSQFSRNLEISATNSWLLTPLPPPPACQSFTFICRLEGSQAFFGDPGASLSGKWMNGLGGLELGPRAAMLRDAARVILAVPRSFQGHPHVLF